MDLNLNLNFGNITQVKNDTKPLNSNTIYDIIIVGGGPSALTAAVYAMRKGFKIALIAKDIGGQVLKTSSIENYMGYMHIDGADLVEKFKSQVKQFEMACSLDQSVVKIEQGEIKKVFLEDGTFYKTKSIILATGQSSRMLNIPGENEFIGKGVAYCSTCDAPLFKNKEVVVVGGGNSGIEAAIDLAKIAKEVTLIQNKDELTADKILIDKLSEFSNVDILYQHSLLEINGDQVVSNVLLKDTTSDKEYAIKAQGVFIEIGYIPNSEFVEGLLELTPKKEIQIDCRCHTSEKGIFAAGDVTSVPYKQIIIAAGEGAKAALSAVQYLHKN